MNDRRSLRSIADNSNTSANEISADSVSIRVSPNGYISAFLIGTFFSGFFIYLEFDSWGFSLFLLSWVLVPFLAFSDKILFDGKRLSRTGILPRIWTFFSGSRRSLRISDIEQVDTQSIRTLRRGGNIYYRYRTAFRGRNVSIVLVSGGEDYRRMIGCVLSLVSGNVMDNRSIELRDHLKDPKEVRMKAAFARIPDVDVLSDSFSRKSSGHKEQLIDEIDLDQSVHEKAEYLRCLGNELRLIGRLHQALESFRRALVISPRNARLVFDFARCLHSFAGAEHDARLGLRSIAALRLAEIRGANDSELLARLGETYFQLGEWRRADGAFQRSIDISGNFRAARGKAELALREGKLAHVIHRFDEANGHADLPALRRYSRTESEYFTRLNNDDEYMEIEVGRVNLLETLENSKTTVLKISFFGFVPLLFGLLVEDTLFTDLGWAVTAVSLLIWIGLTLGANFLASRIPYDLVDTDD